MAEIMARAIIEGQFEGEKKEMTTRNNHKSAVEKSKEKWIKRKRGRAKRQSAERTGMLER